MKKTFLFFLIAGFFFSQNGLTDLPPEKLPPILEDIPSQPFQTLSTVGAGQKTVEEARLQTQREAVKVNADAIILLRCEKSRIRWEGLVFQKEKAYCQGKAIQFQKIPLH